MGEAIEQLSPELLDTGFSYVIVHFREGFQDQERLSKARKVGQHSITHYNRSQIQLNTGKWIVRVELEGPGRVKLKGGPDRWKGIEQAWFESTKKGTVREVVEFIITQEKIHLNASNSEDFNFRLMASLYNNGWIEKSACDTRLDLPRPAVQAKAAKKRKVGNQRRTGKGVAGQNVHDLFKYIYYPLDGDVDRFQDHYSRPIGRVRKPTEKRTSTSSDKREDRQGVVNRKRSARAKSLRPLSTTFCSTDVDSF